MLIQTVIGLRDETSPEQLRYVLVKLREMLLDHPRVDPDSARARFIGFGASSLDIEVFAYVMTRDWAEFLGIQEDILLRVITSSNRAAWRSRLPRRRYISIATAVWTSGKHRPRKPGCKSGGTNVPYHSRTSRPNRPTRSAEPSSIPTRFDGSFRRPISVGSAFASEAPFVRRRGRRPCKEPAVANAPVRNVRFRRIGHSRSERQRAGSRPAIPRYFPPVPHGESSRHVDTRDSRASLRAARAPGGEVDGVFSLSDCQVDRCSLAAGATSREHRRTRARSPRIPPIRAAAGRRPRAAGRPPRGGDEARGQVHEVHALLRVGIASKLTSSTSRVICGTLASACASVSPARRFRATSSSRRRFIDLRAILHELDSLERVAVDRHARGLQELKDQSGRRLVTIQSVRGAERAFTTISTILRMTPKPTSS